MGRDPDKNRAYMREYMRRRRGTKPDRPPTRWTDEALTETFAERKKRRQEEQRKKDDTPDDG